jgi:hypothetical protein
MPQPKQRQKSKQKQQAIRRNAGIAAWRMAAAEYLRKGNFMHLPKRGTPEHAAMRARQAELVPVVRKQIEDEMKIEAAQHVVDRVARNKIIQRAADACAKQRLQDGLTNPPSRIQKLHAQKQGGVQMSTETSDSEGNVSSETGWI